MSVFRFTRTSVFQLTLIYVGLFALSVVILLGFFYWSTIGFLDRQTNATIEAEILGLREQFERGGLPGLVDVVADRVGRDEEGRSIYLFADAQLRPLAGNLNRWPSDVRIANGWTDFFREAAGGRAVRVRARILSVGPNLRLLVGRDIRELDEIFRLLRDTLSLGLGATLVLALGGGLLMSLSAQRRVAQFNRTITQVMSGDFSQRIQIFGGHDEYSELAQKINEMLAQIETLIGSIRHVGDNVAHDLRGPLTRLRNRLELLAAEEHPDSARLAVCVEQADGLLDVFNALLRIARIESGAYRSAFTTFDLTSVVRNVCTLFRAAAEERNISFRSDLAENVRLTGDRELIAQAVSNLLDNAIKYTPAGGNLGVTLARTAGRSAEIVVADSGPGIPEAEREKVADRFYRLDQARSQPGSGLGLALVKAVVDQHGGTLRIGDNEPGLRVTIELPLGLES